MEPSQQERDLKITEHFLKPCSLSLENLTFSVNLHVTRIHTSVLEVYNCKPKV